MKPENFGVATVLEEAVNILSTTEFSCFRINQLTNLLQRLFGSVIARINEHFLDAKFLVNVVEGDEMAKDLPIFSKNISVKNFSRMLIYSFLEGNPNLMHYRNQFRNRPFPNNVFFSRKNRSNVQQLNVNTNGTISAFHQQASQILEQTIELDQICDGKSDCEDFSDERFCPGKFYCANKNPLYVDSIFVMDGVADCSDSSDEWPEKSDRFTVSSKNSLIDSWVLQILIWVIGIIALLGNATVICCSINELRQNYHCSCKSFILRSCLQTTTEAFAFASNSLRSRQNSQTTSNTLPRRSRIVRKWNSVLVLNLAIADLLMGIYLTWLAGVSSLYEGRNRHQSNKLQYWNFDRKWRTSIRCNMLGIILVVSSQTSVFTLVSLTSLRLYTVIKPFACSHLKSKYLVLICCFTWIFSVFLAVTPIFPAFENMFIKAAFVPFAQLQPPDINRTVAEEIARSICFLSSKDTTKTIGMDTASLSWSAIYHYIKATVPRYSNWMFYGFYSEDSVCMPKLFINPAEDSFWGYTVTLIAINCSSVVYIAISYTIICIKSSKKSRKAKRFYAQNRSNSINFCNIQQNSYNSTCLETDKNLSRLGSSSGADVSTKKFSQHSHKRQLAKVAPKCRKNANNIHSRVALLVATDCLCWLPICIIGFMSATGYAIPQAAYAITAVILLPINSALNPMLYSKFMRKLWINVWSALRHKKTLLSSFFPTETRK